MANEVLRHLDVVRPLAFAPIAELPPALRCAAIVRALPVCGAAADLARAFDLAVRMRQSGRGRPHRTPLGARGRRPRGVPRAHRKTSRPTPSARGSRAGAARPFVRVDKPQAARSARARVPQLPCGSRGAHRGGPHGGLCSGARDARCGRPQLGCRRLAPRRSESARQRRSRRAQLRQLVSVSRPRVFAPVLPCSRSSARLDD